MTDCTCRAERPEPDESCPLHGGTLPPMARLAELLGMEHGDKPDDIATEACEEIAHLRAASDLTPTDRELAFMAAANRRDERRAADFAAWLESPANARRETAAKAIYDLVVGTVTAHLANYDRHITDAGAVATHDDLVSDIWTLCEIEFERVTGIRHVSESSGLPKHPPSV